MARGLVWSPEAIEDIESIASYIERDSAWYAKAVASKIVETAETIPGFPELGRIVPEIGDPQSASGLPTAIASSAALSESEFWLRRLSTGAACCSRLSREWKARRNPNRSCFESVHVQGARTASGDVPGLRELGFRAKAIGTNGILSKS